MTLAHDNSGHPHLGDDAVARASTLASAGREAIVTMLAMLATLGCTLAMAAEPGLAVLAVVLCLSFSRSHLDRDLRGRLEAAVALPIVGLLATAVGLLLLRAPWLGAAVFVAGMFLSIWLRRFGAAARRAGSLLALPLVVILTTPHVPARHLGPLMAVLMPIIVALLALGWVALFHALGRGLHLLPSARTARPHVFVAPGRQSALRPVASTRMALQMAVALVLSFVIGYVFFAERWAWIVLTAFIVNSGNRGRLDVAYKSVLRVLGAAAGTLLALSFTVHLGSHDRVTVALILGAVFIGIWLRPLGYAWWALFVTLALALLQGFEGSSSAQMLWPRLEEIVIGAVLGVTSAWLVYPVRSRAVLRRRLADVLAILADAFDPATPVRFRSEILSALASVQELAPAFRASRLVTRRWRAVQPADWVDALIACIEPALLLLDQGIAHGEVRRSIGLARKALREPEQLLTALHELHHSLLRSTQKVDRPEPA